MKKIFLFSFLIALFSIVACKNERTQEQVVMDGEEKIVLPSNEERLEKSQPKSPVAIPATPSDKPEFLVKGYWEPEFVVVVNEQPTREFQKHWVKFNPDFTFTAGKAGSEMLKGKWHLKDTKVESLGGVQPILTFSSEGKEGFAGILNHDWRIQTNNNDILITVGNGVENNTGTQIKWIWHSDQPK